MKNNLDIRTVSYKQNIAICNDGFEYAILCAIFWGIAYYLVKIVMNRTFSSLGVLIHFCVLLSAGISMLVLLFSLFWVIGTGKWRELVRTCRSFAVCRPYIFAAIAGAVGATATYIALGIVDNVFSTVSVLFYPVIGTLLARKWYYEKITRGCALGIGIIVVFSLLLYLPYILSFGYAQVLGCALGMAAGVGWGAESAIAGRAQDITDSDVGLVIRYFWEFSFWCILLIVLRLTHVPYFTDFTLKSSFFDTNLPILLLMAFCLTFNYINFYRGFVYLGVSRGTAISDVSGFAVLVITMALERSMPNWYSIVTATGSLIGVYIIYNDCISSGGLPVLRDTEAATLQKTHFPSFAADSAKNPPVKVKILQMLMENDELWDYEIADVLENIEVPRSPWGRSHYRYMLRQWTVELRNHGFIIPVEESVDSGDRFQKGKRLCLYKITELGLRRIGQ